jgi:hypothetical protein
VSIASSFTKRGVKLGSDMFAEGEASKTLSQWSAKGQPAVRRESVLRRHPLRKRRAPVVLPAGIDARLISALECAGGTFVLHQRSRSVIDCGAEIHLIALKAPFWAFQRPKMLTFLSCK